MRASYKSAVALALALSVWVSVPAYAQKAITQGKVNTGSFTPGDTPGFPLTISQRGSYKLTTNLVVANLNTTAIHITADNVTLDLNGFGIFGPGGGTGTGIGIDASQINNVTVVNGSVRGMGDSGIRLVGNSHRVEKVVAMLNGNIGIQVGSGSSVTGCTANYNAFGIAAMDGSNVSGNVARNNVYYGLTLNAAGYGNNVLTQNNGGNGDPEVSGGTDLGHNMCGSVLCS